MNHEELAKIGMNVLPPAPNDRPTRRPRPAGPAADPRSDLLIASWLKRDIPPRDYLLGSVLCTTSRWLMFGDTGVGKTLLAGDIGGAIASGSPFLDWGGRRQARVMYLDGEMPAETFKERMELIAQRYGDDIPLLRLQPRRSRRRRRCRPSTRRTARSG